MPRRVPSVADRHLLNRFSYGITPQLLMSSREAGGARAWFANQLWPGRIKDAYAGSMRAWFPYLDTAPETLFDLSRSGRRPGYENGADLQRWTLLRRTHSERQVHELMTEFWSNLLHVASPEAKSMPHRARYDATVRTHALGRFTDLLVACDLHPAMLSFLDNAVSTAREINENLGRELLELHTVGIAAGYGEDQVRQSANILTGYLVDRLNTQRAYYSPADHVTGRVQILGFDDPNGAYDGRPVAQRYLRYLATHPLTAQRVAHRLCVRFVSDNPSPAIVDAVAQTFTRSGTDIRATLRTLVDHPDFASSVGAKTRTPTEDGVATLRVLGVRPRAPKVRDDFANMFVFQIGATGQKPFDWPRPDGFPDVADAWTGVTRMLGSWKMHWAIAGGYWPRGQVDYRPPHSFLPALPLKFKAVVDDLSRRLLSRPATAALQQAATAYTGIQPWERIATKDDIRLGQMVKLISVVLDTPAHMSR